MSTTYDIVMETKDRGLLFERTQIYFEYIGALNTIYPLVRRKFDQRYLFVAHAVKSLESEESQEYDISSFKKDIHKEVVQVK